MTTEKNFLSVGDLGTLTFSGKWRRLVGVGRRMSLVAMGLGLGLGSIWAAKEKPEVPDLTKGGKFEDKFVQDWNLGPTGMRGQTWKWSMVTTEARQI
ncbi:MAG: hypothetical protein WCI46_15210, partial [Verrucomicrobiota bacterium]